MNISELSIRKPVFAWMLMVGLILFGALGFRKLGISQLPDVDFPMVNVSVTLEGAAPEVMELNVVEQIESAVMSVQGIKSVTSSSRTGRANISVEFNLGKNIDTAVQEIQVVMAQAQRLLPREMDPPVVSKINPEDQPILWVAVLSDVMNARDLMSYVREHVQDKFTTVDGVGEIFLGGFVDPNLRVNVSTKKLNQYALTVSDVVSAIQSEHSELPSGRIEMKDKELNVRTLGEALSPEEFGKLPINRRGGIPNFVPLSLSQVADVQEGLADVRRRSRSMGSTAVGVGIKKQRGSNAVAVAKAVKAKMAEIEKQLPKGTRLAINFDATQFIEEAVHELNFTLILSALLTGVVCWIFLGSFSATLNVLMAIPTSIVGSFVCLYILGFTLNTFTLLGLSLAIGIVVDDAIMVLENIVRHREMKKGKIKAALDGSREITFAAMAATAAILAIFLPVAFMEGLIGKYFLQFGVTISIAVAISLLEALTLAPMRCAQFLYVGERTTRFGRFVEKLFHASEAWYRRTIPAAVNHPWMTLGGAISIFVASIFLMKTMKSEFVPPQDQGNLMLRLQAPIGSSLDYTDSLFQKVEAILKETPEVLRYYVAIGGFGGGDVDTGNSFVTLKPRHERPVDPALGRPLSQQELAVKLRERFAKVDGGAKIFIQDLSLSGFSAKRGFPIEFTIRGPDWNQLVDSSRKLMKAMQDGGQMIDVDSDYRAGMPEVQIFPDRAKARARGVSVADINQTVNSLIGGQVVAKYSKGNYRYDVRVRLVPEERMSVKNIGQLQVRNNRGEIIPLSDVVHIKEEASLQSINHQDRERAISVFANLAPGTSQKIAIEKVQAAAKDILPEGYRAVVSGSAQAFGEAMQQLLFALLLGIIVSYMILGSQFNSFIHPITVLVPALLFSLSGAVVALILGKQSLNLYSFIGIILLMGISKKNSILLVDFTRQIAATGLSARDAILKACPLRLRPILMTSIATVAGAIPPALAIGPGAESRVPMALAVIGGVIVSTFFTLYVVPAMYTIFSRWQKHDQAFESIVEEEAQAGLKSA